MTIKKTLLSVLIAAGALGAAATPLTSMAGVNVQLNFGPPPVRYEYAPPPPRGYVWAPGYWDWRGHRHVWVGGRMVRAREGYSYQPHRWVEHGGRWQFERARWEQARRHGTDRDGIPNRYDRDGDGVPNRFDRAPDNRHRR